MSPPWKPAAIAITISRSVASVVGLRRHADQHVRPHRDADDHGDGEVDVVGDEPRAREVDR